MPSGEGTLARASRNTTLLVVHILAATSSCVIPAATRVATRSYMAELALRRVVSRCYLPQAEVPVSRWTEWGR